MRKIAALLAVFQLGLEADHVEQRAERVVLAELHDGVGLHRRAGADWSGRPASSGRGAASRGRARPSPRSAGSRRNRACRLPLLELGLVSPASSASMKASYCASVQRAVDVVGAGAARARLVVARLEPGDVHVDGIRDGRSARWRRRRRARVSPVSPRTASASAGEVRGPVATMTLSHSAGGRPAISPRSMVTRGWASSAAVTAAEKPSRSTASAPPAGT